ncbi:MAG: HD-GYP domain-containing protein [Thermoleophilaceae bacterium]
MRLVATTQVPTGALLAREIFGSRSNAIPLLRAGVAITEEYRRALIEAGIHAVYVDDQMSQGIEPTPIISDETRREATRTVSQAFDVARERFAAGERLAPATLDQLSRVSASIAAEIESSGHVALALSDLSGAEAYTHQHSIDVAALGLLLGQRLMRRHGWLNWRGERTYTGVEARLVKLGLGLLLHDIGKLAIPAEILNKPGKLDPDEWELMKSHPLVGVEMLSSQTISALVKIVVRSHHERWDGTGYPDGRQADQIDQLARIASVADVYDAVTSERVYAPARPASVGVEIIGAGAGSAFDALVVEVFRELVAPYPPGTMVELSDGRRGIVAEVQPPHLDRPLVRIVDGASAQGEADLSREQGLRVTATVV